MTDEQRELMRIAAQRVVDDHKAGRRISQEALQWARQIVATCKPLGLPLGTGDPTDDQLPQALRGGALEVF